MTKTPRTDAEVRKIWSEGNQGMGDDYAEEVVDADFARSLELEINGSRALPACKNLEEPVVLLAREHNEFVVSSVDGSVAWWPDEEAGWCYKSEDLRALADEMDRMKTKQDAEKS